MNSIATLLEKIQRAKDLDFGDIISETINLFKKVWVKGLIVVLIMVVIAVCLVLFFNLIGLGSDPYAFNNGFNLESFFSFYWVSALYNIPQTILLSTITLAFVGAFYRICNQIVSGEPGNDDYFYFFKKEYFSKVFMLGIIYTAIGTLAQLLLFIPYIYVFIPLSYFAVILANNSHLTEMEIVKASFALGNKKWLITFGTMFVAGLIAMLGIFGCFIGVLFTMCIVYLPVFLIYKEVVGFKESSEIDRIGIEDDSNF